MSRKSILLLALSLLVGVGLFVWLIVPMDSPAYQQKIAKQREEVYERAYVDYDEWAEGRVCPELRFGCLPESQERSWQNKPLPDGLDTFELTPEVMERYHNLIRKWDHQRETDTWEKDMNIKLINRDFYDRVNAKRFLIEMEQSLEKEFPGFWRDVPKKVRYRWIRRAMNKAKKLGYNESKPNGIIEICARIGIDFDLNPKWEYITSFLLLPMATNLGYDIIASRYIDFTIFGKDKDIYGRSINDWSLRTALKYLPYPKRPIPKLNQDTAPMPSLYPQGAR